MSHLPVRPLESDWAVFFDHLAECGVVSLAAKRAGVERRTYYLRLKSNPDFKAAAQLAFDTHADRLESEAFRRGLEGVKRGVWYKGERVGEETEYSDTLLVEALRARRPEVYRRQAAIEVTGAGGKPLEAPDMLDTARRIAFAVAKGLQLAQAGSTAEDPDEFV